MLSRGGLFMEFLDRVSKKIYEDLLKQQHKVNLFKSINKYAWYILAISAFVIYISIFLSKRVMIVFDNPLLIVFAYLGLISIIVIAACSIYSKESRERAEFLRKKLIQKLEANDFCSLCADKCVHKDEFVEKAEKQYKINLYY